MSTIRVDNFGPSAGGTTYSARGIAKAWCYFTTTTTTVVNDSENISSLTDIATGRTGVSFTSEFADGLYSLGGSTISSVFFAEDSNSPATRTAARNDVAAFNTSGTLVDRNRMSVAYHGDLA